MNCPCCENKELRPVLTQQGVQVELCDACNGIWFDKGELLFFTKKPVTLREELEQSTRKLKPSDKTDPKTGAPLSQLTLFNDQVIVYYSTVSGGLWIDNSELQKLNAMPALGFKIVIDEKTMLVGKHDKKNSGTLLPLPNLFVRSFTTLFLLFALLTFALISLTLFTDLSPTTAVIIGVVIVTLQFVFGPFFMDISLNMFYKITWVKNEQLPPHLKNFIEKTCKSQNIKTPGMGIIRDGSPNAFTYGHTPNNARIVITQGLLDLLNDDEVEGVVAHEIGHAKHWDMFIMTVAQLIPLILYYVYRMLLKTKSKKDKSGSAKFAIAIGAYVLYIISEYIVLWLSRTREYYADRFAGEATGSPGAVASALVKIGYGLAGKEATKKKKNEEEEKRNPGFEAISALGIFDPKSGMALAISSSGRARNMGGDIDKENLKGAMRWDMWNPWAKFYELHSTHPLIANRIRYLSNQSETMGEEPYIQFDEQQPESYWDEFFTDLFIILLPSLSIVTIVLLVVLKQYHIIGDFDTSLFGSMIGLLLLLAGIGQFINIRFSYRFAEFIQLPVASLLKKVKVSQVRPVPCTIQGTIIGRGVPGLIWSEDFVLQDETGIIFLDYEQPIPLWNFLFGLLRSKQYKNQKAEVTGWYRRSPVPYIEIYSIKIDGKESICYTYTTKIFVAAAMALIGFFLLLL